MTEVEVEARRAPGFNVIELVMPRNITGTAEHLIAMLEQTIGRIKDEEQERVRERAGAFVLDEPEVARAVAKIIGAPAPPGTVPGLNGSLLLESAGDAVVVRLRRGDSVFDIGRWESQELRLSVTGSVEIEQAVKAVWHARDVRRVRVLLLSGDRVIFRRGGYVTYVTDAPDPRARIFAEDKVSVAGGHTLWWHGVEVPNEAVQAAGAIMRGLYG